jgi:hypothetical protein
MGCRAHVYNSELRKEPDVLKGRAMPRQAISCAFRPIRLSPERGFALRWLIDPVTSLKIVVFPAPFGPMMALSCPPAQIVESVDRPHTAKEFAQLFEFQEFHGIPLHFGLCQARLQAVPQLLQRFPAHFPRA